MTTPPAKVLQSVFLLFLVSLFLTGCSLQDPGSWLSALTGKKETSGPVSLVYWGLFEGKEVMQPLIKEYQDKHPNVTIDYSARSFSTLSQYKELLLSRLKQGTGPDILRVHLTWLPQFSPDLAPVSLKTYSEKEYSGTFYPVTKEWSSVNGSLYSIPFQYDGLGLYINDAFLAEATGAAKPQTWYDFRVVAKKMAKISTDGNAQLLRAGAAIGNAGNIPHAADIFGLMFAQSDLSFPADISSQAAQDALTFYTNFLRVDKVWSASYPNSVQAFARGQVAMIFAPLWRMMDIINLNPKLKFSVNPVPQAPAQEGRNVTNTNWASFWTETVSNRSKNQEVAWDFLKFLSSKESLKKMYSLSSQSRPLGQPYSRVDLASDLSLDANITSVLAGAPTAQTAPITDVAGNDPYTEAINGAIEANLKGVSAAEALKTAQQTIERLMGLGLPSPSPKK